MTETKVESTLTDKRLLEIAAPWQTDREAYRAIAEAVAESGMTTLSERNTVAYSVTGLAQRWGCSEGHIYNMIKRGELRSFQLSTLIRISADEVARIECGSSSIGESGRSSAGTRKERHGEDRFGPVIVPPPSGDSRTSAPKTRATQGAPSLCEVHGRIFGAALEGK